MKKIFYQLMAVAIAAYTFTACEDVPEPYNNPLNNQKETEPAVEVEPAGSGTQADPWNVTALQKACEGLASGSFLNDGAEVYVKGVVVEATDISAKYGNATYYISDDINGAVRFYVYRGTLLDGAAVTADTDLQVGDTVVVCGKVKNYAGKDGNVLEFDSGNKLVYFAKGNGTTPSKPATEETTIGSATEPITVAKALELINAMEDGGESKEIAFVKGKVVSVQQFNDKYKSITYYISDDGTENGQLQCYSGKNVDGADFTSKDDIQVGQEVIVKGKLKKYVNSNTGVVTPELNQGNELVSASGNGSGDTPAADFITVTKALELINGYADGGTSETEITVKGKIVSVETFFEKYKSITYYISDDGTDANQLQIYSGKGLNGADFESQEDLTVGMVVTVKGTLKKYKKSDGTIVPEMNTSSVILSIEDDNNSSTPGGDTPTADFITVAKALELINGYADNGTSESDVTVKGKIVSVETFFDKYKSITYYISDDGTATNQLQIYSGKGLNGADFASQEDLKAGQVVTVKGTLKKYKKSDGTIVPEMNTSSVILSIEDENNSSTPGGDTPAADFITVAKALELINGYADNGTSESDMTVKGKIVSVETFFDKYKSITYYISDDGTATNQLQIYSGKGLNGADFTAKEDLTVGKVVKVKGTLKKYKKSDGTIVPEMNMSSVILSIE